VAYLFPIGTLQDSDTGLIDSVEYTIFEPNKGVTSKDVHNVLVSQFEQQSISTRKKANPFITLSYEYENIFAREYNQIEHFVNSIAQGGLSSFYVIDFSRGITPSSINVSVERDADGDWQPAITNTRYWANTKIYACAYTADYGFRLVPYVSKTTNASITMNTSGVNYGDLTSTNFATYGKLYPAYEAFCTPDPIANFKIGPHINQDIDLTGDGGYTRSGTVAFVGKYPSV